MYELTLHVPKSLQSHGLLDVPIQRLASCPPLVLQEQDSAQAEVQKVMRNAIQITMQL